MTGARQVSYTSLDKPLWPDSAFRKRDLIAYYEAVAEALVRHIAGRPMTLARFPDGIHGKGWYQTNCPGGRPDWVGVAEVQGKGGKTLRYCLLDEPAAILWAANLGSLEFHPFLATAARPDSPLAMVFDLDPGAPAGIPECCDVALAIRERLAAVGLPASPKVSGGGGVHVYVGLDGSAPFARTKAFVRGMAQELSKAMPDRIIDRMARAERSGKVFVDWSQNDASKSLVAPWSLRAMSIPLVAMPLRWEEVEECARARDPRALRFTPEQAVTRLRSEGDPFRPVLERPVRLP